MSEYVTAELNYLAERVAELETWSYDSPDGRPRFNGRLRAYQTRITNAREYPEKTLTEHGFCCLRRPSKVSSCPIERDQEYRLCRGHRMDQGYAAGLTGDRV